MNKTLFLCNIFLVFALLFTACTQPIATNSTSKDGLRLARIRNDEGGPVALSGQVDYTNAFFTLGVAQPMVILEDQAGFVDRNKRFVLPPESQTIGQITSDFFQSPFSYSLALPIEPSGSLRDVDNDGEQDSGVLIFAIAYWSNTFGGPTLEERDLYGGGWSTSYASTRISGDADRKDEMIGGKLLVYSSDAQQGFPNDFGADGLLFTSDDPAVRLPIGYTLVDLDSRPFTFDRSRRPVIDLLEATNMAQDDFGSLGYSEAFDEMIKKLRKEYAFSEAKEIDWDAKIAEYRPRFEQAERNNDRRAYLLAFSEFARSIPDGHVGGPQAREEFERATSGGLGMAVRKLDDGRVLVNYLTDDGPAQQAGIELRAEIIAINDQPIAQAVANAVTWSGPFSTDHVRELQQLRYVLRSPVGTSVSITYRNLGATAAQTVTLVSVAERESFEFSSFQVGRRRDELPVEYEIHADGYGYARIYSFSDNELLTVQLWERMIQTFRREKVSGVIIDMRQNSGGSGFLADQLAAYFFDQPLELGSTGRYNEKLDAFFFDPRMVDRFILPPEDLRYQGKVAVLVGPSCQSACEFFAYDISRQERASIVGQYPTAGMGGSIDGFRMPEGQFFQYTAGRAVDMEGNIHIEGQGVAPTIRVPVDARTLFSTGDPVLEAAVSYLKQ